MVGLGEEAPDGLAVRLARRAAVAEEPHLVIPDGAVDLLAQDEPFRGPFRGMVGGHPRFPAVAHAGPGLAEQVREETAQALRLRLPRRPAAPVQRLVAGRAAVRAGVALRRAGELLPTEPLDHE